MNKGLIHSSCLIEAIKAKYRYPSGKIGWDFDSPSGWISFYFDYEGERWRFRRKLRRYSNKGHFIFWGYRAIEKLK